jgi:serine/threonine protein kinase
MGSCLSLTKKEASLEPGITKQNLVRNRRRDFRELYDVLTIIGKGSIGNVYKVSKREFECHRESAIFDWSECVDDNVLYALKEIDLSSCKNKLSKQEMLNEIQLLKKLHHPSIIRIFDVFEDEDNTHLAMVLELCQGGDLSQSVPHSETSCIRILQQVVQALDYLHKQNLIHRDIKSENIMLSKKNSTSVKLIDFGLAVHSKKNRSLGRIGSIGHMAPEVLSSQEHSSQADMWSVGVVAFELLTGKQPFGGKTNKEISKNVIKGSFDFDASEWKLISGKAKDFIKQLIVVSPADRMTAAQALEHEWVRQKGIHTEQKDD